MSSLSELLFFIAPCIKCSLGVQKSTKVKLGATAGLRLLPEGKADHILAAVQDYLGSFPFILDPKDGVTILDGENPHFGLLCVHVGAVELDCAKDGVMGIVAKIETVLTERFGRQYGTELSPGLHPLALHLRA